MDVYALRKFELEYELQLRGWASSNVSAKTADELRKNLRGHLLSEKGNRSISDHVNEMPFELDSEKLTESLNDIRKVFNEADKPLSDAIRHRLVARMSHVSNRFRNLHITSENLEHQTVVCKLRKFILDIEVDLADEEVPISLDSVNFGKGRALIVVHNI